MTQSSMMECIDHLSKEILDILVENNDEDDQLVIVVNELKSTLKRIEENIITGNELDRVEKQLEGVNGLIEICNKALEYRAQHPNLYKFTERTLWLERLFTESPNKKFLITIENRLNALDKMGKLDKYLIRLIKSMSYELETRTHSFVDMDEFNNKFGTNYCTFYEANTFLGFIVCEMYVLTRGTISEFSAAVKTVTDMTYRYIEKDQSLDEISHQYPYCGVIRMIGYELLRYIKIEDIDIILKIGLDKYMWDALKDFDFNNNTMSKMLLVNVDTYKGLSFREAGLIQILKEYIRLRNKKNKENELMKGNTEKIGDPKDYIYANALYFDEDLSNISVTVFKRLNILALTSTPFKKAIDIAKSGRTYYKWRTYEADISENREFIQELEDTYGFELYMM